MGLKCILRKPKYKVEQPLDADVRYLKVKKEDFDRHTEEIKALIKLHGRKPRIIKKIIEHKPQIERKVVKYETCRIKEAISMSFFLETIDRVKRDMFYKFRIIMYLGLMIFMLVLEYGK